MEAVEAGAAQVNTQPMTLVATMALTTIANSSAGLTAYVGHRSSVLLLLSSHHFFGQSWVSAAAHFSAYVASQNKTLESELRSHSKQNQRQLGQRRSQRSRLQTRGWNNHCLSLAIRCMSVLRGQEFLSNQNTNHQPSKNISNTTQPAKQREMNNQIKLRSSHNLL